MPATISHPTSALRVGLVALGAWLVFLVLANTYLSGRQGTDENVFLTPWSRAYVAAVVEGTPGMAVMPEEQAFRYLPSQAVAASELLPGDLVLVVDGAVVQTLDEAQQLLNATTTSDVLVYRPGASDLVSVKVPSAVLADVLYSIENMVLVVEVSPGGASHRAGMLVGDIITRINGQGFSTAYEADEVMRQSGTDRETVYDILRGGQALSLNVRLAAFGVTLGRALLVLVGLLYIVTGLVQASLRPHIKAARYLGLAWMGIGIVVALLFSGPRRGMVPWVQTVTDVFVVGGGLFGMAAWLHALHYFPRERTALVARRWVRPTAYALAALGLIVTLGGLWRYGTALQVPVFAGFLFFMVAASWGTRRSYGAEEREMLRPLTRSVAWGLSTALALVVVGLVMTRGGPLSLFVLAGVAAAFLAILAVHVYVIGRYRLLESDLRLRRNVQYLLVSSAWTFVVVAAGLGLWWTLVHTSLPIPNVRMTGETIEILPTAVSAERRAVIEKAILIAAAVVLAFVFRAVLKRGHRFLAEQYYREGYDYRKATQELSEVMGARMDLDGLADGLLTVIDRLMPVKKAGVAFVEGTRVFAARRSTGFDQDDWDLFCRSCVGEALGVLRETSGEFDTEYAPPRLRLALRRAEIHYLYPIRGHNELRGVLFIGEKLSESAYTSDDFTFLNVIASQASLLVENAFLYENVAQQERAQHELAIARRIQLESLPQEAPRVAGLDIAGTSVPALEVGGDYFDYLCDGPGTVGIMVGDVSGKGTSAALYMSKLQGIVQSLHTFGLQPRELFTRTNELLGRDLERRAFVTALGAFFDVGTRTVTVVRAGHLPLLHYEAASGRVHPIMPRGLGFGLVAGPQFDLELQDEELSYAPGDVFLLLTDGINESHSATGDEFGQERVETLLRDAAGEGCPASEIVSRVKAAVDVFTEGTEQQDDQTIVVVRASR